MVEKRQHLLYLSDSLWANLLYRHVLEEKSASDIISFVLSAYQENPRDLKLLRRRTRSAEIENLRLRKVYISDEVWEPIRATADAKHFSMSALAEYLLREYLGMEIPDDLSQKPAKAPSGYMVFRTDTFRETIHRRHANMWSG